MFNKAETSIEKFNRDQGTAPYTPTTKLLTKYKEKGESFVRFATRRAVLSGSLWLICAMRASRKAGEEKICLPLTCGLMILTGLDRPEYTAHNDSEVREDRSPEIFALLPGFESICFQVCHESRACARVID